MMSWESDVESLAPRAARLAGLTRDPVAPGDGVAVPHRLCAGIARTSTSTLACFLCDLINIPGGSGKSSSIKDGLGRCRGLLCPPLHF
jgi:hypothetical protein